MGKNWHHQGGHDTDKLKIGSHQPRSHLRDREKSGNSPSNGRTEPQDEFSRGGEPRGFGAVHPGA